MKSFILRIVAVLIVVLTSVDSDHVFRSTAHLQSLLTTSTIQKSIQAYIGAEEQKLAFVKKKLAMLEEMKHPRKTGGVKPSEHPIGVYHILRAYYDINATVHNLNHYISFRQQTIELMPNEHDLLGASLGVVRLQTTYKLKAYDLIRGKVGEHFNTPLDPYESYHIARTAFDNNFVNEALDWMKAIYEKYGKSLDPQLKKGVLLHLAYCYEKIPDIVSLQKIFELLYTYYPNDPEINAYHDKVDERLSEVVGTAVETELSDLKKYETLCRGEEVKAEKIAMDVNWLICRYRPMSGPYDTVKEEILSFSPFVLFFHDVVTEKENLLIKELSTKRLQASMTFGDANRPKDNKLSSVSHYRTSKTGWLFDAEADDVDRQIRKITKRITRITGLSSTLRRTASDAEALQVVNYGIGGHYAPHLDPAPQINHNNRTDIIQGLHGAGDRIATFLMYLSDVIMGGSTVFPRAGLRVDAVNNGALFWYNLLPSGAYDWLTLHAGCPVVIGQKWIANKWLRETGQMFRRPCGMDAAVDQFTLNKPIRLY